MNLKITCIDETSKTFMSGFLQGLSLAGAEFTWNWPLGDVCVLFFTDQGLGNLTEDVLLDSAQSLAVEVVQ